jgi:hypothetical protein
LVGAKGQANTQHLLVSLCYIVSAFYHWIWAVLGASIEVSVRRWEMKNSRGDERAKRCLERKSAAPVH